MIKQFLMGAIIIGGLAFFLSALIRDYCICRARYSMEHCLSRGTER